MELIPLTTPLASRGYERIQQDGGVAVYQKRGAAIVDLAADGSFPFAPERVRAVLLDYEHHARFVHDLAESRVLRRDRAELTVYQRLDLPVLSDRDYTLAVSWGAVGSTLWLKFGCANQRGPAPRSGVVRVWTHDGGWLLQPAQGGKGTVARYQVQLDLAGSVPRWMARSGAGREVPALFRAVASQIR